MAFLSFKNQFLFYEYQHILIIKTTPFDGSDQGPGTCAHDQPSEAFCLLIKSFLEYLSFPKFHSMTTNGS